MAVTEEDLEAIETEAGIRLPAKFRDAVIARNLVEISTDDDRWIVCTFNDTDRGTPFLNAVSTARKWSPRPGIHAGFPRNGWAFAENGFGDYLFFKTLPAYPEICDETVYVYWHETGKVRSLAADITQLE